MEIGFKRQKIVSCLEQNPAQPVPTHLDSTVATFAPGGAKTVKEGNLTAVYVVSRIMYLDPMKGITSYTCAPIEGRFVNLLMCLMSPLIQPFS
jgi:hypothetical protein